ncbi:MAG: Holliday junction resolvase-like protein [Candidatus Pacearchaeota archaeon]
MVLSNLIVILLAFGCLIIGYLIGHIIATRKRNIHWEGQIEEHRKDAIARSRAVLAGQFSEQLAPYLPDFPFNPSECKFIGKPVDFLVFHGLDEKNVTGVSFVEVKSGKSKLSSTEITLKDAILRGKVNWAEYRVPDKFK